MAIEFCIPGITPVCLTTLSIRRYFSNGSDFGSGKILKAATLSLTIILQLSSRWKTISLRLRMACF